MDPPCASIVIPNYNGRHLLDACLSATLDQARAHGAEVILVDNGSSDGSAQFVRARFPDVVVVELAANVGFAGGCNAGARLARSDRVILLNNDAVPEPGWLANLLRALGPEDVAVACSVVHEAQYPEAYALGTGSISVIGHPIPNVAEEVGEPFYAHGCSLGFKRDLLGEPFDDVFFAYYEDTVLSWRARLRGYQVVRALDSGVRHLGSATAWKQPARALYYWERNKLLALLICYRSGTVLRLVPLYLFDGLIRLARDLWLVVKAGRAAGRVGVAAARRYWAAVRGLVWLASHPAEVGRLRRWVQSGRRLSDRELTVRLSGKIFDDLVPTRLQTWANRLSLAYCALVGIPTAESRRSGRRAAAPAREPAGWTGSVGPGEAVGDLVDPDQGR